MRNSANWIGSLWAGAVVVCACPAFAAAPDSPPVVQYRIEVSLDPETKILQGRERLVWRNPSSDRVGELRFHLYLNAFKNDRSTFMRESGGHLRLDRAGRKPGDWGWIDVSSMKTGSGEDLRPGARFIQPDGGAVGRVASNPGPPWRKSRYGFFSPSGGATSRVKTVMVAPLGWAWSSGTVAGRATSASSQRAR